MHSSPFGVEQCYNWRHSVSTTLNANERYCKMVGRRSLGRVNVKRKVWVMLATLALILLYVSHVSRRMAGRGHLGTRPNPPPSSLLPPCSLDPSQPPPKLVLCSSLFKRLHRLRERALCAIFCSTLRLTVLLWDSHRLVSCCSGLACYQPPPEPRRPVVQARP